MSNFVTFNSPPDMAYNINVREITAVSFPTHHYPKDGVVDMIVIHNAKGEMFSTALKYIGGDKNSMLQSLKEAGCDLVTLPIRQGKTEFFIYAAPKAVSYVTFSEAADDGRRNVIAGIAGYGRFESYGVNPDELDTFIAAIRATGKNFLEFDPSEAHSRFHSAAKLYIAPADITSICNMGGDIQPTFAGIDELDIHTPDREYEAGELFLKANPGSVPNAHEHTGMLKYELEASERAALAAKLADANGRLVFIPGTSAHPVYSTGLYVRPEEITWFTTETNDTPGHSSKLNVHLTKQSLQEKYDTVYMVWFATPEDCLQAAAALNAALTTSTGPDAPATKPSAKSGAPTPL